MGGLFGGTISMKEQQLAGIQLQTSAYGICIPVGYGKNRVPGNLLYFADFRPIPHTTTQGGKGGPKVKNTTYTYDGTVIIGVQAGPITSYGRQFADKDVIPASGWSSWQKALGAFGQSVWAFLTSKHPTEADPYSGIAYVGKANYDMGSSGTLKNHSFETVGFLPINVGAGKFNASPASIVEHMLADPFNGIGFPSAQLGTLSSSSDAWKYTAAAGLLFSPLYTEQAPCREHLTVLADAANFEYVWSEGVLKVVPYADSNVSGSASGSLVSYVANVTPLYNITDDDYLTTPGDDPVVVKRKRPADAWNRVEIEFKDQALDYNTNIVPATDQANIELYGLRSGDPIKMHFITDMATAALVAQIILQRKLYIRNTYEFRVGWRFALLEPMDLVTLTDANLGLVQQTVRITKIVENSAGELTITAVEWPFGTATPALFATQAGTGYAPDTQVDPGNANAPVIFEPPLGLTAGEPQIWIATSGGPNCGGFEIWVSRDGTTYAFEGYVFAGCRHGVLSSLYSGGTLAVDLSVSGGSLTSASTTDANAIVAPIWVDGEVMTYTTATLTGTNAYNLTTQNRGAYGTTQQNHAAGTKFVRLDDAIGKFPTPQGVVGQTLSIKLVAFNVFGQATQDISTLTPYTYTVTGGASGPTGNAPSAVTIATTTTRPA